MNTIVLPKRLKLSALKLAVALSFVLGVPVVIILSMIITFGIGAGLIWLLLEFSGYADRMPVGIIFLLGAGVVIGILAQFYGLLKAFISQTPFEPAIRVNLDQEPKLKEFIEEIANKVGTKAPQVVLLHSLPEFYVSQGKRITISGTARGRVLAIGLPLLPILSTNELSAILAHEFAHFHGNDTLYSTIIQPVYRSTLNAISIMKSVTSSSSDNAAIMSIPLWFPSWFLSKFVHIFNNLNISISRQRELRSDFIAASIVSGEVMETALKKIVSYSPTFSTFLHEEAFAHELKRDRDFFSEFERNLKSMLPTIKKFEEEALHQTEDSHSTHPCLSARIRSLPKTSGQSSKSLAATSLFVNLDTYRKELNTFHWVNVYHRRRKLLCEHLLRKLQEDRRTSGKTFSEIKKQKILTEEEINFCVDVLSETERKSKEEILLQFKVVSPEEEFLNALMEGRINIPEKTSDSIERH